MAQYVIDTNVLLRLVVPAAAQHPQAAQAVKTLLARDVWEIRALGERIKERWCMARRTA
jgi:hypothetical protein